MSNIEITDAEIDNLIDELHPIEPVTEAMVGAMAASLQASPDNYDDGPVAARAMAVALRCRALGMRALGPS